MSLSPAILGLFAKLRKLLTSSYLSVCLSVCPSVRPHATTRLKLDRFSWNFAFGYFYKIYLKMQASLKSDKNKEYFTWIPIYIFIIAFSVLLRMRNFSEKFCRENQNTYFVFNNVFRKSYLLWDNMEKYWRAGEATYENMTHAHCMLDTKGYKHTLSEYLTLISFPLQQWLHESASMLLCTYIACLVYFSHRCLQQLFVIRYWNRGCLPTYWNRIIFY